MRFQILFTSMHALIAESFLGKLQEKVMGMCDVASCCEARVNAARAGFKLL